MQTILACIVLKCVVCQRLTKSQKLEELMTFKIHSEEQCLGSSLGVPVLNSSKYAHCIPAQGLTILKTYSVHILSKSCLELSATFCFN